MGKPRKVKENSGKTGETWIYERRIGTRVDPVSPQVVHETWIDPIDNQVKQIAVPMQDVQRTDWVEVVELEMVDDSLARVDRSVVVRRATE